MPARIAAGKVGHAVITSVRFGSAAPTCSGGNWLAFGAFAFALSSSPVQAAVQAAEEVAVSSSPIPLAILSSLIPKLDVEGSSPFARFS